MTCGWHVTRRSYLCDHDDELQLLHDPVTREWITDLHDMLNLLAMNMVLQSPSGLFSKGGCCHRWLRLPACLPACLPLKLPGR